MSSPVPDELIAILLTLNTHPSPTDDIKKVLQDLTNQKSQPDWPSALANLGNLLSDPFRTDYLANLNILQNNPDKKSNLTITRNEHNCLLGIIPAAIEPPIEEPQNTNPSVNINTNETVIIAMIEEIRQEGEGPKKQTTLTIIRRFCQNIFLGSSSSQND